jgi:aryl-alcohol dehydrogenase-like predicted oxidoreductase/HEAT repeat protein
MTDATLEPAEPRPELVAALDPRPSARAQAVAALGPADRFALRSALLLDTHAHVRAAAAVRLGRLLPETPARDAPAITRWLLEASRDGLPSVRTAAYHALARCGGVAGEVAQELAARLRQAALEEPSWWARRTAVVAVARLDRTPPEPGAPDLPQLETLLAVLDDPFWRVRHAALQALAALGHGDPAVQALILRQPATDDVGAAAKEYLRRQWSGAASMPALPALDERTARASRFWDEDPAVMTARLEARPSIASPAELVELLATPHAPLRRLAVRALERRGAPRALQAALLWLEEPRLAQAAEAARELLARAGAPAEELAAALLSGASPAPGPRSVAWALEVAGERGLERCRPDVARHLGAPDPALRRAALLALARLGPTDEDERALAACAGDASAEVREAWLGFGLASGRQDWLRAALEWEYAPQPLALRRLLVQAALALQDRRALEAARRDDDWQVRLHLTAAGAGDPAWLDDGCPLLAVAAACPEGLVALVAQNASAEGRRAAWARLEGCWAAVSPGARQAAVLAASAAGDPWLRSHAAARLGPRPPEVEAALRLFLDPERAVRAAATSALLRIPDELVEGALGWLPPGRHAERKAAHAWLARGFEAEDLARLAAASAREPPEVAAFLRELVEPARAAGIGPSVSSGSGAGSFTGGNASDGVQVQLRPLGTTGLLLPPLVVSGAHEPSLAALSFAASRGASAFFWEPRHRTLSRFLADRHRQPLTVLAGSFEASAAGIRRDVERALRRLRRERIELFLLFWVRSPRRLDDEAVACLERLQREGKIAAAGFSTHDRALACDALRARRWDAVMIRHSAAHTGAERALLPLAAERGTGVLGFSALCYGRMLRRHGEEPDAAPPSAADCYRYTLGQPGVAAVISAPRRRDELEASLPVLAAPALSAGAAERLRRHGERVYQASRALNALVRKTELVPRETRALLDALLDESLEREPAPEERSLPDPFDAAEEEP